MQVESSMARPRNYGRVLAASMALITVRRCSLSSIGISRVWDLPVHRP